MSKMKQNAEKNIVANMEPRNRLKGFLGVHADFVEDYLVEM